MQSKPITIIFLNFESRSWLGVLDPTLCNNVCQLTCDRSVVFPGDSGSSTNKTDHCNIDEILLKVALNTITLPPSLYVFSFNLLDWFVIDLR